MYHEEPIPTYSFTNIPQYMCIQNIGFVIIIQLPMDNIPIQNNTTKMLILKSYYKFLNR